MSDKLLWTLIPIVLGGYLTVWVHEAIGRPGIIFLILFPVLVGVILWYFRESEKPKRTKADRTRRPVPQTDERQFDALAQDVLHYKLLPTDTRKINEGAMQQKKNQLHEEKMKALSDAWDAAREDRDYRPHLKRHHLKQLEEIECYEGLGIHNVRVVATGPGGNTCPACEAFDGFILGISAEKRYPHLPPKGCTCRGVEDHQTGFCVCQYEVVFDDEL